MPHSVTLSRSFWARGSRVLPSRVFPSTVAGIRYKSTSILKSNIYHDLDSYTVYVAGGNVDQTTSHHQGTLYELGVKYMFDNAWNAQKVVRCGRANDKGIDLKAYWFREKSANDIVNESLPFVETNDNCSEVEVDPDVPRVIRALVQCKSGQNSGTPKVVRETIGGFSVKNVSVATDSLGILVSPSKLTPEAHKDIMVTKMPLVYVQMARPVCKYNRRTNEFTYPQLRNGRALKRIIANDSAHELLQEIGLPDFRCE